MFIRHSRFQPISKRPNNFMRLSTLPTASPSLPQCQNPRHDFRGSGVHPRRPAVSIAIVGPRVVANDLTSKINRVAGPYHSERADCSRSRPTVQPGRSAWTFFLAGTRHQSTRHAGTGQAQMASWHRHCRYFACRRDHSPHHRYGCSVLFRGVAWARHAADRATGTIDAATGDGLEDLPPPFLGVHPCDGIPDYSPLPDDTVSSASTVTTFELAYIPLSPSMLISATALYWPGSAGA